MITSRRRPGRTAMTLAIAIGPSGVRASKDARRTWRPARVSSPTMYCRARASAAEPAGRGPSSTSRTTSRQAAPASKEGAAAASRGAGGAATTATSAPPAKPAPSAPLTARPPRAHDAAAPGHTDHLVEHRRRLIHVEEDRHGERDVEPTGPEGEPAAVGNPEGDAPVEAVDMREAARGGHARPARVDTDDLTAWSDHPGEVAGDDTRPAPDLKHAGSPAHGREPEEAA